MYGLGRLASGRQGRRRRICWRVELPCLLGRSVFLECGVRFSWERGEGENEVRVVATARMRARARVRLRVLVKDVVRV